MKSKNKVFPQSSRSQGFSSFNLSEFIAKAGAFIRLTRPFFLLGGVLLNLLGTSIAISAGGAFDLASLLLGQLLVTSIQLMVHYSNEYYDREVDQASAGNRTWFSGGSGVLPDGGLTPLVALHAAQVCAGISFVTLVLVSIRTPVMSVIGVLVLFAAWFYSAPPLRLVSTGWGEFTASIIVAFFVPLTGWVLQSGLSSLPLSFLVLCLTLVLIHMGMLITFELPDVESDAAFGKRTLTVRLGLERVAWLHNGLIAGAFIIYGGMALLGTLGTSGRFIFLAVPLAVWQEIRIVWHLRHREASFDWLTLGAVSLFGLSVLLWMAGIFLPA